MMTQELEQAAEASSPDDPDELYRSIGLYIFWFSQLDRVVQYAACDLLGLSDKQAAGLLPVIDFRAVCHICLAKIPEQFSEKAAREQACGLIKAALNVNDDRNRVAHGHWDEKSRAAVHASR